MEKQNVGDNHETAGYGNWLSKQDSRRNFGGDTPKGSIGSALIQNGDKHAKNGSDPHGHYQKNQS